MKVFCGPVNKQRISAFSGVVTRNYNINSPKPTAVIAAVDVYVTDWGTLDIMPSRFQRERDVYFLDFDFLELGFLRPFKRVPLAKTGDASKTMLLAEWVLKVNNEAALGAIFDRTA
jgi:hypothetical protein